MDGEIVTTSRRGRDGDDGRAADVAVHPADRGPGGQDGSPSGSVKRPRLDVRVLDRVAIARFADCEILIEATARSVEDGLARLVEADGHSRLLLNLRGVRYLPVRVLETVAALHRRVERGGGFVRVCGPDPLVREVLRTSRLDRALDICGNEAEALGLLIP